MQTKRGLVLGALVLAVAIVMPAIQSDLALSPTGAQWVINGYLLALAALFALRGRPTPPRPSSTCWPSPSSSRPAGARGGGGGLTSFIRSTPGTAEAGIEPYL
jgi:hypothetical protein